MGVHVDWDSPEHTILIYSLDNAWTWDEAFALAETGTAMIATVPHMVDVIVDFQNCHTFPPQSFSQFQRVASLPTPQTNLVIIAGGGTLLLTLYNLFTLMVGGKSGKYRWASNVEQARAIIRAQQPVSIP